VPNQYKLQIGYSLIELMVAVGLVAVLASVAAPSFTSAMQSSRMTSHYNSLSASLTLARSEGIKRASNVSVCAMESDEACGTDWNKGWFVFSDNGETVGNFDDGEEIIKRVTLDDPNLMITNSARLNPGIAPPADRPFIRFGPRGASNWRGSGFFQLCDDRGTAQSRAAIITLSGAVRKARRNASDELIDSFGSPATC